MITDDYCRNLFESEKIPVEYVPVNSDSGIYRELLTRYQPVCLISVERCGKTAEKDYINMRGISIASKLLPSTPCLIWPAPEGFSQWESATAEMKSAWEI